MEQRDYFLRHLNQFGKALSQVLSKMLQGSSSGDASLSMEAINDVFQDHLNVGLNEVLEIPIDDFIDVFEHKYQVSSPNFEVLAEALLMAENSERSSIRALVLLKRVHDMSEEFSIERQEKIKLLEFELGGLS